MKNSRTQNAFLTFLTAILTKIVQYGIGFFVTPALITFLGSTYFGIWQMMNQFINYISFVDIRPTNALKYVLASKQFIDDNSYKRRQVGASLLTWLYTLPVLLFAGSILIYFLPMITKVTNNDYSVIRIVGCLLIVDYVFGNLAAMSISILRGENLGYKGVIFGSFITFIFGLITILVVQHGFGLVGLGLVTISQSGVTGLLYFFVVKKNVQWLGVEKPSRDETHGLFRFATWILLSSFSGILLFSTEIVIVGWRLGANFVTVYVITKTVVELINNFVFSLVSSSLAGLGDLFGRSEFNRLREVRANIQLFTFYCISVIGTLVISLNRSFIGLWVGNQQYAGNIVNLILVIAAFEPLLNQQDSLIIDLTQNIKTKIIITFLSGMVVVTSGVLLTPSLGIFGMSISSLLGRFSYFIGLSILCTKKINESPRIYFQRLIRPTLICIVLYVFAFIFSNRIVLNSWFHFILIALFLGISVAFIAWWCELNNKHRKNIVQYFYFLPAQIRHFLAR